MNVNTTARLGGFFWLLTFIIGSVGFIAASKIVVAGNASATATNIVASESLYRFALVANIVSTVTYIAATVFVYELLKAVSRSISLLAATFSLLGCAASAATFVLYLAPVIVSRAPAYLSVFTPEQRGAAALALTSVILQGSAVAFFFFGLHCFLVGTLIFRSTFMPRLVGVLMMSAGVGWLTFASVGLLALPVSRPAAQALMLPGMIGEASITLWLLIMGVNAQRWREQAAPLTAIAQGA